MVRNIALLWLISGNVVNSFQIIIFADGSQLYKFLQTSNDVVNSFQIIIFADGSQHEQLQAIEQARCE